MTTSWNAFLPIGKYSDETQPDPAWCAAMGVDPMALTVLRQVRRDVLPLIRDLERPAGTLREYSFLVHDRSSGVPCPPEDPRAFIHLRLEFFDKDVKPSRGWKLAEVRARLPESWVYLTKVKTTKTEEIVQLGLYTQAKWYLGMIEQAGHLSDLDLLRHVGQQLHYYANMAQMMVR